MNMQMQLGRICIWLTVTQMANSKKKKRRRHLFGQKQTVGSGGGHFVCGCASQMLLAPAGRQKWGRLASLPNNDFLNEQRHFHSIQQTAVQNTWDRIMQVMGCVCMRVGSLTKCLIGFISNNRQSI